MNLLSYSLEFINLEMASIFVVFPIIINTLNIQQILNSEYRGKEDILSDFRLYVQLIPLCNHGKICTRSKCDVACIIFIHISRFRSCLLNNIIQEITQISTTMNFCLLNQKCLK